MAKNPRFVPHPRHRLLTPPNLALKSNVCLLMGLMPDVGTARENGHAAGDCRGDAGLGGYAMDGYITPVD